MSELNNCSECCYKIGYQGEEIIRKFLASLEYPYMQADLLFKGKESWLLAEIKRQSSFKSPPFDGHGLPEWQIKKRLLFQKETGIRAIFFVVDKETEIIYYNYFDELYNDQKQRFNTNGKKPRVIFPLESFKILKTENSA